MFQKINCAESKSMKNQHRKIKVYTRQTYSKAIYKELWKQRILEKKRKTTTLNPVFLLSVLQPDGKKYLFAATTFLYENLACQDINLVLRLMGGFREDVWNSPWFFIVYIWQCPSLEVWWSWKITSQGCKGWLAIRFVRKCYFGSDDFRLGT